MKEIPVIDCDSFFFFNFDMYCPRGQMGGCRAVVLF